MRNKKGYLEVFKEEQEKQYIPWEYPAHGQPAPLDEAKGNPVPLAIMYVVGALVYLVGFAAFAYLTKKISLLIVGIFLSAFWGAVAAGYFRKAASRKKANRAARIEDARKRKRRN